MYKLSRIQENAAIMVVGCGGTGGFVAEGLCRLLVGKVNMMVLVDHDRVEERNLGRQNFFKEDLGRFKAQVLAERLAVKYGREIEYAVSPVEFLKINDRCTLTIGCVDNAAARKSLQYCGRGMFGKLYCYSDIPGWYIDAGNGEHSGQVLIGNSLFEGLGRSFSEGSEYGKCFKLPLPTVQRPELLIEQPKPDRRDCAERVVADEQSPVINQAMSAIVLQFVHLLFKGDLSWMGAYIDLETMTTSPVPADPETVARMTGLSLKHLVYHPRPVKERVQVRV